MWTGYWPMPWMFFRPMIGLQLAIARMAMMFFVMRGRSTRSHVDILKCATRAAGSPDGLR